MLEALKSNVSVIMNRPLSRNPRRALLAALLVASGTGCVPPDRPVGVADPIPERLTAHLGADTVRTVRIGEGLWYRYLWSDRGPWGIHVVEADLNECALGYTVLTAEQVTEQRRSFARTSDMASAAGVVVAVNGDFFLREGIPRGPEVLHGDVRRNRGSQPAFAWSPRAGPRIGTTRRLPTGELGLQGFTAGGFDEIVGGLPQLLDDGTRVYDTTSAEDFRNTRHPRTAVGLDEAGRKLWLVVVDGRQEYSAGMTLEELRELFDFLGAHDALNLDGGGSSTMVVAGHVVNRPSDVVGERSVVNGLGIYRDRGLCPWSPDDRSARPQ